MKWTKEQTELNARAEKLLDKRNALCCKLAEVNADLEEIVFKIKQT